MVEISCYNCAHMHICVYFTDILYLVTDIMHLDKFIIVDNEYALELFRGLANLCSFHESRE